MIVDSSFNLAVHALICLSHSGRSLSSEALAENICTNPTRVRRVLAGLKKAGMVETREGLDGGYRLTADPATPYPTAGGGGGKYPLCGLRVAQRRHRPGLRHLLRHGGGHGRPVPEHERGMCRLSLAHYDHGY